MGCWPGYQGRERETEGEREGRENGAAGAGEAQGLEWAWRQFVVFAVAVAVGAQFQSVCFTFLHIDSTARGQGRGGTRRKGGEKLSLWLSAFCILTGWQFNIYICYLFCGLLINARTRVQPTLNASVIKNINAMADAKCESFNGYAMNTQQSSSVCVSLCPCGPRVKREFFLAWPTGHS